MGLGKRCCGSISRPIRTWALEREETSNVRVPLIAEGSCEVLNPPLRVVVTKWRAVRKGTCAGSCLKCRSPPGLANPFPFPGPPPLWVQYTCAYTQLEQESGEPVNFHEHSADLQICAFFFPALNVLAVGSCKFYWLLQCQQLVFFHLVRMFGMAGKWI